MGTGTNMKKVSKKDALDKGNLVCFVIFFPQLFYNNVFTFQEIQWVEKIHKFLHIKHGFL